MNPFTPFESPVAILPVDNIDTDQIIPARFLKTTTKEGLGKAAFSDWRYDTAGEPRPDFVLNQIQGVQVLLAGDNFGCGSSREHAPWALTDFGLRAVISTSFADIFFGNALKNGLLPIKVSPEVHASLLAQGSGAKVKVDLEAQTLTLADGTAIGFPVDPFSKRCMLLGVDELGYLLQFEREIAEFEGGHTAPYDTRSVL
ncbi:MAG: 3-isopropylmalate dehydratase, small subunit [Holophagaceae bacterium]|nr:3-isopropylmalate dehydratase, small subunit [Holophagaceae bacterium]